MRVLVRSLAACTMIACATVGAKAIEPQAPSQLITAEEAVLIAIRTRLQDVKVGSRPTQREKGEAIDREGLANFYARLGDGYSGGQDLGNLRGRPLWVTANGLTEQALRAKDEILNAAEWGLDPELFELPEATGRNGTTLNARQLINLEMKMSLAILKYARHARGGRMDPTDLSLDIDRKPPLLPAEQVLAEARQAEDIATYLQGLHPKHEQFVKLREAYLKALDEEADGAVSEAEDDAGRRSRRRRSAKRRASIAQRLLYNMEMWRWMPEDLGERYVWANIPEFRIRVVKEGDIIHSERMITGKVQNKTPVFSDELETVVFRPNWGVPNSIKVKEILPKLMRGGGLERQGLRVQAGGRDVDPRTIDWSRVDIRNYHIYQPPGQRNALGLVKFLFPNKHAVYFHDTPTKYLFKKKVRAFSHGCMRVRNPMKMAEVIFNLDRGWGATKVASLANAGIDNQQISLNRKIPVHVTYFTARANEDGEIEFENDIYGHEKLIQKGFDGQAHTIVKENRSLDKYLGDRVGRVASDEPRRPRRSRDWMRRVWGVN